MSAVVSSRVRPLNAVVTQAVQDYQRALKAEQRAFRARQGVHSPEEERRLRSVWEDARYELGCSRRALDSALTEDA